MQEKTSSGNSIAIKPKSHFILHNQRQETIKQSRLSSTSVSLQRDTAPSPPATTKRPAFVLKGQKHCVYGDYIQWRREPNYLQQMYCVEPKPMAAHSETK